MSFESEVGCGLRLGVTSEEKGETVEEAAEPDVPASRLWNRMSPSATGSNNSSQIDIVRESKVLS